MIMRWPTKTCVAIHAWTRLHNLRVVISSASWPQIKFHDARIHIEVPYASHDYSEKALAWYRQYASLMRAMFCTCAYSHDTAAKDSALIRALPDSGYKFAVVELEASPLLVFHLRTLSSMALELSLQEQHFPALLPTGMHER
eukprot:5723410-Pleurochrysis_carterae.AAC.3